MKIFYRRPLSLILCIMLGVFSLFPFISNTFKLVLGISAIVLLGLTFIRINKIKNHVCFLRALFICFIVSAILSYAYFDLYFKAYERYDDNVVEVEGVIREVRKNEFYAYITVEADTINSDNFSDYKLLVALSKDSFDFEELKNNTRVTIIGKIGDFSNENADFDLNLTYMADGYSAKITEVESFIQNSSVSPSLSSYFSDMRNSLTEFMVEKSGERAGNLLSALLLGEKQRLSPKIKLDFDEIGISHILALSGLHLAILVPIFTKLMALFGAGKKLNSLLTIIFTILYMVLTGFPVSVIRAGLMLIISSLLYLFAKARDPMTNLLISVSVIIAFTPFAVFDISLWLSALATLGIVALSERPYKRNKKFIEKLIIDPILVSVFAISATFIITVFIFKRTSLLAPFTTLIFSFITEIFLYVGLALLLFGSFLPIGPALRFIADIIAYLAAQFAKIEFASASADFLAVKILSVIFTVIFFLFLILDIKKKRSAIAVIVLSLSATLLTSSILTFNQKYESEMFYSLNEGADAILIVDNGIASLIEEATYTNKTAYKNISLLKEQRIIRLEHYVLTSYNASMIDSLYTTLYSVRIEEIYLPEPLNDDERTILNDLLSLKDEFGAIIRTYKRGAAINLGNSEFQSLYREGMSARGSCHIFEIISNGTQYAVFTSGILNKDTKNAALEIANLSDVVIFCKHGRAYYDYSFVYEFENPEIIIFSSKGMYISDYMKAYYKKSGVEIYLTPDRVDFIR